MFVDRSDASRSVADARRLVEAIRRGEPLVIFPEGTFSRAPGLRPFHMGAFLTAAETGTPVVPVAVQGTRSVLRGDEWFPRKGEVRLVIGRPIEPDGDDWSAAVRLRDRVREEILRSCGEPDLGT
jgi:1-acyl-sn-glycerol-3-phosphate acyltransferase